MSSSLPCRRFRLAHTGQTKHPKRHVKKIAETTSLEDQPTRVRKHDSTTLGKGCQSTMRTSKCVVRFAYNTVKTGVAWSLPTTASDDMNETARRIPLGMRMVTLGRSVRSKRLFWGRPTMTYLASGVSSRREPSDFSLSTPPSAFPF